MDIEKTRYCYLAVLYLFSFFGDIFLRLHLRDLCYTRHNERLKNRDYFSFHIYIRLTLCYNVFSRGILWLKFGRVFNSSPTPSASKNLKRTHGIARVCLRFFFFVLFTREAYRCFQVPFYALRIARMARFTRSISRYRNSPSAPYKQNSPDFHRDCSV